MTTLIEKLEAASYVWLHEAASSIVAPPQHLYHYTSGAGLFGILSSGRLWGSNYAFMNDRSEFGHGLDILCAALEAAADSATDQPVRACYVIAQRAARERIFDLYLTCFCEEADLLSQWRGYGNQGSRYCLEFVCSNLPIVPPASPLQSVIYDEDMQRQLARRCVEIFTQALSENELDESANIHMVASRILLAALPALTRFKKAAFREEREWRCVVIDDASNATDLEFSSSGGIMRPHRILVGRDDGAKLPISRVISGASRSESQARRSAELLLAKFGYSVPVTASQVPLAI